MREQVRDCQLFQEGSAEAFRAGFRFPPDLPVFAGHFPGLPIVPGIFLLEAARIAAERAAGKAFRMASVVEAKFTAEVGPGEEIEVHGSISQGPEGWLERATIASPKGTAARISLRLVPEDPGSGGIVAPRGDLKTSKHND
jgi:3-hydroxyacyl-[acyl-carrier-protein] dehydratase